MYSVISYIYTYYLLFIFLQFAHEWQEKSRILMYWFSFWCFSHSSIQKYLNLEHIHGYKESSFKQTTDGQLDITLTIVSKNGINKA